MKYYSTEGKSPKVSFKDTIIDGIAPDRGLYMPEKINRINDKVLKAKNYQSLSFEMAKILLDGAINDHDLFEIVNSSFNFPVPVNRINDKIFVLELFHGPTAAFKDFGARFMARTLAYFLNKINKKITIIVATSGDTGSAVAKGFYKIPNIDVIILYPSGKVSYLQEKQLTTLGENIVALEVKGTFDDCQKMAKDALVDKDLISKMNLSSANSINVGRLFPQSFYYVWAYNEIKKLTGSEKVIFCTPSGNFGNLTAGLIAKKMGLPVEKFIAATNINDVVPEYLQTGIYKPRPSQQTYSNAMDVGNPSNFARILALYKTKADMEKDIVGYKITDDETTQTIKDIYKKFNYILDPHGAVGFKALSMFLNDNPGNSTPIIFLETAHPAKFNEIIKASIGIEVPIPSVLEDALKKEKKSIVIENKLESLKEYLLKYNPEY